jgi:hypothetical protein
MRVRLTYTVVFKLLNGSCYVTSVETFHLILLNYLLILKMLTETLLIIPCHWWIFSSIHISLDAGKIRKIYMSSASFPE